MLISQPFSLYVIRHFEIPAQRKIPVVLYPVHHNPRFHGQKSILLLFIHEMPCFRGQERHKAGWPYLPSAVPCKSFLIFHYHPGICRFFRMSQPQLYVSSGKYVIFPDRKTVLFLSHDVSGLPVSLTSYANFVVNEFFSVTVVNEMQVLLTTHESTNFSSHLFTVDPDSPWRMAMADGFLYR